MQMFHKATSITFLLFIFIPPIAMLIGVSDIDVLNEKRTYAEAPDFPTRLSQMKAFKNKLESYFNDNFGFRHFFIKSVLRIKLYLGVAASKRVIYGENNWLFYHSKSLLKQVTGEVSLNDQELKQWESDIIKRQEKVAESDGVYYTVIAPNKHTVYSEYLPGSYKDKLGPTQLDRLMSLSNKKLNLISFKEILRKKKDHFKVYYASDTHWTKSGAYFAYVHLVEKIQKSFPNVGSPITNIFRKNIHFQTGDLGTTLGFPELFQEEITETFISNPKCKITETNAIKPKGDFEIKPFISRCNDERMPTALIFRDSFFVNLHPLLEHFSLAVVVPGFYDQELVDKLLKIYKFDIVIEERAERCLKHGIVDANDV